MLLRVSAKQSHRIQCSDTAGVVIVTHHPFRIRDPSSTQRRALDIMPGPVLTTVDALITRLKRGTTVTGIIDPVATRTRNAKKEFLGRGRSTRRSGRPPRADAPLLRERILHAATELFLDEGYGSTSIDSVAVSAGVSKRTFYDRFHNKAALFAAVVHRIVEQIRPGADVPLLAGRSLPEILRRLAGLILKAALSPQALALHRLVTGESRRFPELANLVETEGGQGEATALIAGLLAKELGKLNVARDDQRFAADQFIYMVVTLPQRRALGFGQPMTATELEMWTHKVVALFLEGYKGLKA
jgi:TetR/AcrR family transcriptional regulator, mexJK operon transcriptional repressor